MTAHNSQSTVSRSELKDVMRAEWQENNPDLKNLSFLSGCAEKVVTQDLSVSMWQASAYFCKLASMIEGGSFGPGACLFQSSVSR